MKRINDNDCETISKIPKIQYKNNDQIKLERKPHEKAFFAVMGSKDLFLYITSFQHGKKYKDWKNGDMAVSLGYLSLILLKEKYDKGHLKYTEAAMNCAAKNGHLEIIIWLHENRTEGCTREAMDCAARNGHLDIVIWLHENRTEGCTREAMDLAAADGHLETLIWLHENRTEGCTAWAMNDAAHYGRFEIVKWLYENRKELDISYAIQFARAKGHNKIVFWLTEQNMK